MRAQLSVEGQIRIESDPVEIDIVLSPGARFQLSTPEGERDRTCVFIEANENGKLSFLGGADIIEEIKGEDMAEKVEGALSCSKKQIALLTILSFVVARHDPGFVKSDDVTSRLFEAAKRIHQAESESEFQAAIVEITDLVKL